MILGPDIKEAVGVAVARWADHPTDLPLILRKAEDGVILVVGAPRSRFTKGEFAEALSVSRSTFAEIEQRLGLSPAHDGKYDAETVEWARFQLRQEEGKKTPHELRLQRALA